MTFHKWQTPMVDAPGLNPEQLVVEIYASAGELRRYIRRFTRDRDDAADLFQDVCLLALIARRGYRGTGSPKAWLLRVARTACVQHIHRTRRGFRVRDLAIEAALGDSTDAADTEQSQLRVEQARAIGALIDRLPLRQRLVATARLLDGLSVVRTAEVLQCSAGTVKATLHAARRRLRSQLFADAHSGRPLRHPAGGITQSGRAERQSRR
jgi:RNA polymerase sigma-70 factor, ECF subfamily